MTLAALAVGWLFGALVLWPLTRFLELQSENSLLVLKWAFFLQLLLQTVWSLWLGLLWLRGTEQIEEGLLPLYAIGTLGWLVSTLALMACFVERYRNRV
jgi:hypothetical protein